MGLYRSTPQGELVSVARIIVGYKKATKIEDGVAICNVGYANCTDPDDNHYHCGHCGGITGMYGHYQGQDRPLLCKEDGVNIRYV